MSLHIIVIYVSHPLLPYKGCILISLYLLLYLLVSKFPIETTLSEYKLHRPMYSYLPQKFSQFSSRLEISFLSFLYLFDCL